MMRSDDAVAGGAGAAMISISRASLLLSLSCFGGVGAQQKLGATRRSLLAFHEMRGMKDTGGIE